MKIHEYQAKSILARYGVPVPRGEVAFTGAEAGEIARRLGGRVVVKAQIHAGGRGKGGGVKLADTPEAAQALATGALHEDGLADSVDGFWGGATRERRLEIMKDSRIGSYGALALILSVLIRWTALSALLAEGSAWSARTSVPVCSSPRSRL